MQIQQSELTSLSLVTLEKKKVQLNFRLMNEAKEPINESYHEFLNE